MLNIVNRLERGKKINPDWGQGRPPKFADSDLRAATEEAKSKLLKGSSFGHEEMKEIVQKKMEGACSRLISRTVKRYASLEKNNTPTDCAL